MPKPTDKADRFADLARSRFPQVQRLDSSWRHITYLQVICYLPNRGACGGGVAVMAAAQAAHASWRFGGLHAQSPYSKGHVLSSTSSDYLKPSSAPPLGRQRFEAEHLADVQRRRPQPVLVRGCAAQTSTATAELCSAGFGAHNAAGQLLLKSLTWSHLESWCAASGACLA